MEGGICGVSTGSCSSEEDSGGSADPGFALSGSCLHGSSA